MENPKPEEENIIQGKTNYFRLEKLTKEPIDITIKDIRNPLILAEENKAIKDKIFRDIRNIFRLGKENEAIKDIILWDIRNIFENEEENYYKLVRESNFWNNSYIEYKSNGDWNKKLSIQEYLNKIRHHK